MADKDLKTLTLDGTTFRTVLTDKNIGKAYENTYTGRAIVPANVESNFGGLLTVAEDGLYHVFLGIFGKGDITGDCYRHVRIAVNGAGEFINASVLPNQLEVWLTWEAVRTFKRGDVIQPKIFTYASFTYTDAVLRLTRLPVYPDV